MDVINNTGQNDASSKAMTLNSPEVVSSSNLPSLSDDDLLIASVGEQETTSNGAITNSPKEYKTKNRRVSFPDDDKIISGYGEPRNPWAHAKTTSTEELIQAYTQSCQQWGVKPITKLLVQLQEINDFSVRAHSITLKGERLDSKVVETLEAVFKRVQFVVMDLEATNLDGDSAAALFDMIEYYESAVNVLVGFNKNLGTRGWQAAAHMMRKMTCLRLFDGHSVPLTDQAIPFVVRALRLSTLVTLHLESVSLSGKPIVFIVGALRMNRTLRELFLADNQLISTDALLLANLLKFETSLQLLDIRNNLIQDAGLCHLCSALICRNANSSGGLQTLVLWNNQLSHRSMGKLAKALEHSRTLSTLNLGQNVLGDDGTAKLKDGLLRNQSLLRLGMVGTKLTCEGAIALAEFLAESPRIIRLDIRNNDIRVGGLMALSLAFKINYSLLRLDIDKPNRKDVLKELLEKQDLLLKDVLEYAERNKELALQRYHSAQLERQRRMEDEKASGFRYMVMTHAAGSVASTSRNNNNSKRPIVTRTRPVTVSNLQLLPGNVDDSPINSPELLPINSVSYHQVAPVMFSSSEMEKRAAKARSDAAAQHQADLESKDKEAVETDHVEVFSSIEEENSDAVGSSSEVLEESPQDCAVQANTAGNIVDSRLKDRVENVVSCDPSSSSASEVISGEFTDIQQGGAPCSDDSKITEEVCDVKATDNGDCDVETNKMNLTDEGSLSDSNDAVVTVSHFDLSLFPRD